MGANVPGAARREGTMIAASASVPFGATRAVHILGNIALDPGGILAWILAGLLAGWLAGLVVRGRGFGCLGNILLGLIGAFVGAFVLSLLPVSVAGFSGFIETLVVAFLGALLVVAIGRFIGGSWRAGHAMRAPRYPPPRDPYGPYGGQQ